MSVNCWIIFQLDLPRARAKKLLERTPLDCRFERDCYRVLYEEERYRSFEELAPEEQSAKLELHLGEPLLRHLKPRGVYVVPEVGQSFKRMTFGQMTGHGTRARALFVKCLPGEKGPAPDVDPTEEGIVAVLEWVKNHKKRLPEVANDLMRAILEADWKRLGALLSERDELKKFAKAFENRPSSSSATEPASGGSRRRR